MANEMRFIDIARENILLDQKAANDLIILLSRLHERRCTVLGICDDMEKSTQIAKELKPIVHAYNDVEAASAEIDDRECTLLVIDA